MQVDVFDSKDMYCGEIRRKGITVTRTDGEPLVISTATYQLFTAEGTALTELADATIDGASIYAEIEAGDAEGWRYVEFTYTVGTMIAKAQLRYSVQKKG